MKKLTVLYICTLLCTFFGFLSCIKNESASPDSSLKTTFLKNIPVTAVVDMPGDSSGKLKVLTKV